MNDFEKTVIELMRPRKQYEALPGRDKLLLNLHSLNCMATGRIERLFCDHFLSEIVQLLANAIFLFEDGYFDCAFYALRQASEVGNTMLYLANQEKSDLASWDNKDYFPMNRETKKKLTEMDAFYSEVRIAISDFFQEHDQLIKKAHKIIHKQGFDTFYGMRDTYAYDKIVDIQDEFDFFMDLYKHTVGFAIIMHIILDPISLVLTDYELSSRFHFDPITDPADVELFTEYLPGKIIEKVRMTEFFQNFCDSFANNEQMSPPVFDVVRSQAYDIDALDEIERQKHLIPLDAKIILDILKKGIEFSRIYPRCESLVHLTSIRSNYSQTRWSISEYEKYLSYDETFNEPYHNIYRSVTKVLGENWIFEHNDPLSQKQIETLKMVIRNYQTKSDAADH